MCFDCDFNLLVDLLERVALDDGREVLDEVVLQPENNRIKILSAIQSHLGQSGKCVSINTVDLDLILVKEPRWLISGHFWPHFIRQTNFEWLTRTQHQTTTAKLSLSKSMIHITELWYVSLMMIWLCKRNRNQEVLDTPHSSKSARTNSIECWILNSNLIITEIDKIRPIQN